MGGTTGEDYENTLCRCLRGQHNTNSIGRYAGASAADQHRAGADLPGRPRGKAVRRNRAGERTLLLLRGHLSSTPHTSVTIAMASSRSAAVAVAG